MGEPAKRKRNHRELRIRGVSDKTATELKSVAYYYGVDISKLLRPKIKELIDSYPEHMKRLLDE
jgi:hypothetical protein